MTKWIKKLAASAAIAGALASGAVMASGTANADYLQGITMQEVERGMCTYLDSHPTLQGVSNLSYGAAMARWPRGQLGYWVMDAAIDVCPRHQTLVTRWGNDDNPPTGNAHDAPNFPLWVTS